MERVPDNYEAAKQLLRYGLRGTDSEVVSSLGQNIGPLPFLITSKHGQYSDDEEYKKQLNDMEESLDFARYEHKILSSRK